VSYLLDTNVLSELRKPVADEHLQHLAAEQDRTPTPAESSAEATWRLANLSTLTQTHKTATAHPVPEQLGSCPMAGALFVWLSGDPSGAPNGYAQPVRPP
jgi:hypothetical protein